MANADAPIPCPNCRQPMQGKDLEQNYHGQVRVDLCFGCAGIWFDHLESVQLAPSAIIDLFKDIHAHLSDARQPVARRLGCPRCPDALTLAHDVAKSGRFSYFSCPRGDGRFTPFFQFLREKQFVRSLTDVELSRVRAEVRQIRCSECGAPIDLEHDSACRFCHAPVSFLDPDAVEKALHTWSDANQRRQHAPSAEAMGDALRRIQLPRGGSAASPGNLFPAATGLHGASDPRGASTSVGRSGLRGTSSQSVSLLGGIADLMGSSNQPGAPVGLDLIVTGIRAIGRLFEST